jgi:hypothetical protein
VSLNSKACAGIKGKQERNAAIPHGINADAKVLASIRWAHEHQEGKKKREYSLKAWQRRMPNRKHRKDLKLPHSPD